MTVAVALLLARSGSVTMGPVISTVAVLSIVVPLGVLAFTMTVMLTGFAGARGEIGEIEGEDAAVHVERQRRRGHERRVGRDGVHHLDVTSGVRAVVGHRDGVGDVLAGVDEGGRGRLGDGQIGLVDDGRVGRARVVERVEVARGADRRRGIDQQRAVDVGGLVRRDHDGHDDIGPRSDGAEVACDDAAGLGDEPTIRGGRRDEGRASREGVAQGNGLGIARAVVGDRDGVGEVLAGDDRRRGFLG